ncbi:MAG TPA: J domain-containing protein [Ramlibacter sp.]|uniref:J domain-containing protein n=1 Tax=Ramlibacter sp. TaxID=1917967 RepID=UPI002C7136D7|nr:J domain-containing protein [Ramlibacter sp.]HVZ44047.1 J domain-containing protein [Ramlibacter sp.]
MTSIEIFAILFFGVMGYLAVSHFLDRPASRKPSRGRANSGADDGRGEHDSAKPEGDAPRSWWEVLAIPPNASVDNIRQAYRIQVSKYHPDKVSHLGEEFKAIAERRAKEINAAYDEAMRSRGAAT